jgi:predicted N-acyltransferase
VIKEEKIHGKIAAILVKDFYTSSKNASEELKEFKYHDFLVEPNMIVNINWKTFEEYLNAMSKKYRNRAKGIVKKGLELQRKQFSANDIKEHQKEIQQLYDNVHLKAAFSMASLSTNYFVEMKKNLQDKFNFIAYYHNEKLIGFKTSFVLDTAIEAHFIGLNYEVNKELELYQNMLYDYVKEAIDHNLPQLFLGRTASEIKSTVGAEAYQLTCYIRHRNPLSNRIIKPFIDAIKPSDWIPRNPFKEVAIQEI